MGLYGACLSTENENPSRYCYAGKRFMCQPIFSLKILGIQKPAILPSPLLLAANALQKVW